jgi:hypothetical protein
MCQTAHALRTFVRYRRSIEGLRLRAGSKEGRGRTRIRVLVAIEEEYRSYREVIAACIRLLRPHVEVSTTATEGLERKAASFEPQLIVTSRSRTAIPSPLIAWITIPTDDPTKPTEVWLGEDRWEVAELETNVVGMLGRVIDRAEEALAAAGDPNAPLARPEGSGDIARHEDRQGPDTESDETSSRHSSPHLFEERDFGIP